MMGADHPNVVKAYHFVTWGAGATRATRPDDGGGLGGGSGGHSGSGNGVSGGVSSGAAAGGAVDDDSALLIGCSIGALTSIAPDGASAASVSASGSGPAGTPPSAGATGGAAAVPRRFGSAASEARRRLVETWLLLEWLGGGNLQDALLDGAAGPFFRAPGVPALRPALRALRGAAEGMRWLHARGVLHGDLKAGNCMLKFALPADTLAAAAAAAGGDDVAGDAAAADAAAAAAVDALMAAGPGRLADAVGAGAVTLTAKVSDFGLSRVMADGATHLSTHTVGTITHQAPELIRTGRLSKPADVFSFGVLMWEVVTGRQPWKGMMMGEVMTAVAVDGRRLEFGAEAPREFAALARRCMAADPGARPAFDEVCAALGALEARAGALEAEVDAAMAAAAAAAVVQPPAVPAGGGAAADAAPGAAA